MSSATRIALAILVGVIVGAGTSYGISYTQSQPRIADMQVSIDTLMAQVSSLSSALASAKSSLDKAYADLEAANTKIAALGSGFVPQDGSYLRYKVSGFAEKMGFNDTTYTFHDVSDTRINITTSARYGVGSSGPTDTWAVIDPGTRLVTEASVNLGDSLGKPTMVWMSPSTGAIGAGSVLSIGATSPPYLVVTSEETLTTPVGSFNTWRADYALTAQPPPLSWSGENSSRSPPFNVGDWPIYATIYNYGGNVTVELHRAGTYQLVEKVNATDVNITNNAAHLEVNEPGSYYLTLSAQPGTYWTVEIAEPNITVGSGTGDGHTPVFRVNSTSWSIYTTLRGVNCTTLIYRAGTNELVGSIGGLSGVATLPGPGSFYAEVKGTGGGYWSAVIEPPKRSTVEREHYTIWFDEATGLMVRYEYYSMPNTQRLGSSLTSQLILSFELEETNIH